MSKLPMASRMLLQAPRRAIAPRAAAGKPQNALTRQFRRGYADGAAPARTPKPRRFRAWRWTWRLLKLSLVGGVAYVGYGTYQDRHPEPQVAPDPSKKTLVILGKPCRPSPSPPPCLPGSP